MHPYRIAENYVRRLAFWLGFKSRYSTSAEYAYLFERMSFAAFRLAEKLNRRWHASGDFVDECLMFILRMLYVFAIIVMIYVLTNNY